MRPELYREVDALLRRVSELLAQGNVVSGATWTHDATTNDGRPVRHLFKLKGYVRNRTTDPATAVQPEK